MSDNLVILDTDCGVDDALALMLAFDAHQRGLCRILAVTCCYGNVSVEKVVRNVFQTKRLFRFQNAIPVFRGADRPLSGSRGYEDGFMGSDGLGDATHAMAAVDDAPEAEPAAHALCRLTRAHPGRVQLLTLGPLTNAALAQQLDASFLPSLKRVVAMGGLFAQMLGNVGPSSEFNFFNDPEAVHCVLANSPSPVWVVPWDTALHTTLPWETYDEIVSTFGQKSDFFHAILKNSEKHPVFGRSGAGLVLCDILVVVCLLFPDLCTFSRDHWVAVELSGHLTRGQLVVDRTRRTERRKFAGIGSARFLVEVDAGIHAIVKRMVLNNDF